MTCCLQRQRGAAIAALSHAALSHDDLSHGGLAQPGLLGPGGPTAGPPLVGPPWVFASWTDGDQVFDARDAGHLPGDPLGLLALCPGSNGAAQRHGAAIGFDGYAIGIDLGAATKGLFDLASDLHWRDARADLDEVGDSLDPAHPPNGTFRPLLRVVPLDLAFERQPAIAGDDADMLGGIGQFGLDGGDGVAAISGSGR